MFRHHPPIVDSEAGLVGRLVAVLRAATGNASLAPDHDGDVAVRRRGIAAYVRMHDEGSPQVVIHAPLLLDVDASAELLHTLNALNGPGSGVRFFLHERAVVAYTEIPALPLVDEHVAHALDAFCLLCDGLPERLREEFGGRTPVAGDPSRSPHLH
jgi:hypothetical protein